ncbi:BREX-1 system phosphatase PglZ type A [Myxococcota bacterium]
MDIEQLVTALKKAFHDGTNANRIVFWQDEESAFQDVVGKLPLDDLFTGGVTLLRLNEMGALEAKLRIEREKPNDNFLLYAPFAQPGLEDDWLLDVRLYGQAFNADRASMVMAELGLEKQAIKDYIATRLGFFDEPPAKAARKRLADLKSHIEAFDTPEAIDLKMMAVLSGASKPDIESIPIALLSGALDADENGGDYVDETLRFGLAEEYWKAIELRFGFDDAQPNLDKLAKRLMVTEFGMTLESANVPKALAPLVLPKSAQAANAHYCLTSWRDSTEQHPTFDRWSRRVSEALNIVDAVTHLSRAHLAKVPTFLDCERRVLSQLLDELTAAINVGEPFDLAAFQAAIATRRSSYWVRDQNADTPKVPRSTYRAAYMALDAAGELVHLRREYEDGFSYDTAEAFWGAYAAELWRFDAAYRRFHEAADRVGETHDSLKALSEAMDGLYGDWFLDVLGDTWMALVEKAAGPGKKPLLEEWSIPNVVRQIEFFERFVKAPLNDKKGPKKVFVIISDALRFEVAQEIASILSKTYRYQATLDSMLGVVPTHTPLGMAALLPHETLAYDQSGAPNSMTVKADGKTTSGLPNRDKILKSVKGGAFDADELRKLSKDKAREATSGLEVIYLYERGIDSIAEGPTNEDKTFFAARETINKLNNLVQFVVNTLNGSHVLVTADHGFLYEATKPTEVDKSKLGDKPSGAFYMRKRYVLGESLPTVQGALKGKVSVTAGTDGDVEFLVPRGTQLFHFTGGARYVHGGVMPQEIVVPVITVKHLRGKKAKEMKPEPVEIQLLKGPHRIVTNRHKFELLQMQPVGDKELPAKMSIGVYDGSTPVSNVEELIFDSTSDDLSDRTRDVWLTVKGDDLSKKKWHIEIRNLDTLKVKTIPVTIDIAFNTVDF